MGTHSTPDSHLSRVLAVVRDDPADGVRGRFPEARVRSRHERASGNERPATFEALTEKQEAALRAATATGFFDRPQGATASDVAETLDVSPSTFLHHLRTAEAKVFRNALGEEID